MRPPRKYDALFLTKNQWRKVFLAMSIMTLALYTGAVICSLCGSSLFILNYQNEQMDNIEHFLRERNIIAPLQELFMVIETSIVLTFVLYKIPKWYYIIAAYTIPLIIAYSLGYMPSWIQTGTAIILCLLVPIFTQFIETKSFNYKQYLKCLLRLAISIIVTIVLQALILVIKAGYFDGQNHVMNLSATFIYAIEYDIALGIILYTVGLFLYREKGDSDLWTSQPHGGSSQTSKMQSQKSLQKNLTKNQKNKLHKLYAKMYIIQLGTFLLVMVIPFLLGKMVEFLTMYVAFVITRYILGFKYSLHFKKESLCVSVSLIIFGSISLAVPFFYIVIVVAILFGVGLAILLHLSYKYKSLWLFNQAAKPDKFALLYTFFDGNLNENYIKTICTYKGLDHFQTLLIYNFMRGEKLSYLAFKFNYSQRMLIYKLDEAIEKLTR